jgi:hypothetical protein
VEKNQILFRVHAIQRMFERNVSAQDVSQALQWGETIEDYSAEMPEPSRLILTVKGRRPLHVVTSENQQSNEVTVITVYIPDPEKWSKDFRSRKS